MKYQIAPERFDACMGPGGKIRPAWNPIQRWIESVGCDGLAERDKQLQQLIRDNGATFTIEGDHHRQGRPWKLAPIPLAIDSQNWETLSRGLGQRARLLEAVLDDLLGKQVLIREGVVPPELLWANPSFSRSYLGLPVAADALGKAQRLIVTATDLTRLSDGNWFVVGDRTRAPSGLGYLLENRITTSQVLSQLIRGCNVRRVASFFFKLRSRLQSLAPRMRDNPRVALLTPGPSSYRYFEDAYLARYLGYTLVQGSDLAVREGRLNLKTLGGLLPIEVLWRHVSDRECDPLELDPISARGVTGLLRTVRNASIAVVNAFGSELAQMPALAPFLPGAAKHLLGEELELPNVDTFWCGGEKELSHVLANFNEFVLRDAFVIDTHAPVDVSSLSADERESWAERVKANPKSFVAQRHVQHSTTPVFTGEEIEPWNVSLRSFQVADGDSVEVLPGGLARVAPNEEALLGSPTTGQLTLDCWITDQTPVVWDVSLLPDPHSKIEPQRGGNELPSRVAEHLFWLGRYVERCESIARLLRTTLKCLADETDGTAPSEIPRLTAALAGVGQIPPDYAIDELGGGLPALDTVLPASVFSREQPEGLQQAALSMVYNATAVRDRLSVDAYRILQRIIDELSVTPPIQTGELGPAIERLNRLIADLLSFAGLSSESMTRTHGWRFLQLGRKIERTHQTVELLSATLVPAFENERRICEALLETTESAMTYRSRYMNLVRTSLVIDLLVNDETNPRSIMHQVQHIDDAINHLPRENHPIGLAEDQQCSRQLLHSLQMSNLESLDAQKLGRRHGLEALLKTIDEGLPKLSDAIVAQYFFHTSTSQTLTGSGK